ANHPVLGPYTLSADAPSEYLFTENETNYARLFQAANSSPYVKDGIHRYIVGGERGAVNPEQTGTKAALHYQKTLRPGETWTIQWRWGKNAGRPDAWFDALFKQRQKESDEFYQAVTPETLGPDAANVQRQAFAGMLWSKQYYNYVVRDWLQGDPAMPPPP